MTTDTKAVAQCNFTPYGMVEAVDGHYVPFTDHERVVGELKTTLAIRSLPIRDYTDEIETLRTALAASRAEVEGLQKAVGTVCEGWTLPDDARKVLEKALWANTVMENNNG
ncbi:hypothetical protein BRC2024_HCTLARHO_CDS_0106 [Acinetobacter phage vB_AbaS_Silvergun]